MLRAENRTQLGTAGRKLFGPVLVLIGTVPALGGGIETILADRQYVGTTLDEHVGRAVSADSELLAVGGLDRQDYLRWDSATSDWVLTGGFSGSSLLALDFHDGWMVTVRGPLGAAFVDLYSWFETPTPTGLQPIASAGDVEAIAATSTALALGRPSAFSNSGRVTVWNNNHGTWEPGDTFQLLNSEAFGFAVDLASDGSSTTLAIGIPGGTGESGRVQVWRRAPTWNLEATLTAPGAQADNDFGAAVALDGPWLAIGAPRHDTSFPDPIGVNAGAVYLYRRDSAGTWNFQTVLVGVDGDQFGSAVALKLATLAVGAPLADVGPHPEVLNAGRVDLFRRQGGLWGQIAVLQGPEPGPFDHLGTSVTISPRGVVAGAPEFDGPVDDNVGIVYTWSNTVPLFVDGFESGNLFAWSSSVP